MAKGIKYFTLTNEEESVINALTNEQAGKLLKTIYSSINEVDYQLGDSVVELVLKQLEKVSKKHTKKLEETGLAVSKTLEERREETKKKFYDSIRPYVDQYSVELLREFYEYWTEHGEKDRKVRFEKQSSFSVKRRLDTFYRNSLKFAEKKTDENVTNISELRRKILN